MFLRHTLAVSECYVQIKESCLWGEALRLKYLAIEPECWRAYEKNGKTVSLRPDLYAEIISGEFEDRWFIEMDLDTEAVSAVLEKCRRYHEYYKTEKEQKAFGVFPLVLWIVPSAERKERIETAVKETFGKGYVHIFLVIVPEELEKTLQEGADGDQLC